MRDKKITEVLVRLNNLGNEMYSKFGTESYTERCELHDIKELLKQVNGASTSQDQALNLACVSGSLQDIKTVIEFLKWLFRKIDKGDTPQETVRMLLMYRSLIDSINVDSNDR